MTGRNQRMASQVPGRCAFWVGEQGARAYLSVPERRMLALHVRLKGAPVLRL